MLPVHLSRYAGACILMQIKSKLVRMGEHRQTLRDKYQHHFMDDGFDRNVY